MQHGIDQEHCCPMASQWLGYMQDAAEGLGLWCVRMERKWKHFGGGKDQRELDGKVTAVKKYVHKALTCRKLDYVSFAGHSFFPGWHSPQKNVASTEWLFLFLTHTQLLVSKGHLYECHRLCPLQGCIWSQRPDVDSRGVEWTGHHFSSLIIWAAVASACSSAILTFSFILVLNWLPIYVMHWFQWNFLCITPGTQALYSDISLQTLLSRAMYKFNWVCGCCLRSAAVACTQSRQEAFVFWAGSICVHHRRKNENNRLWQAEIRIRSGIFNKYMITILKEASHSATPRTRNMH